MTITAAANTLILNSTISVSIDDIAVIGVYRAAGEFFRKAYLSKDTISDTERKYTFYLTELEAQDILTKLALGGNGATVALGSGTEMCTQNVNIDKTGVSKSLLIYWNVKVV